MDVMEAIQKRRSIRKYRPDNIPEDVLERLLNALRLAPSGGNAQPWKFIVVRDKGVKLEVVAACTWYAADGRRVAQDWIEEAPVVIVCCGKRYMDRYSWLGDNMYLVDCTNAIDHLTLAARNEGLGTCWIGAFDHEKVKRAATVPDGYDVIMLMPLGFPASPDAFRETSSRRSLEAVVSGL